MTIKVKRVRATALRGSAGPIGPAGTISGASTFVPTTTQPATPSNGTTQALVEFTTPTNPAGQPSPAIIRWSASHNPYTANEQGFTHPAYTNKTTALTIGYTSSYSKEISTEAAVGMFIEHGFHVVSQIPGGGTAKGCEFHWQMAGSDHAGYRPITAFAPWTAAHMPYDSGVEFRGAYFNMLDGNGDAIIQYNFRGNSAQPKVMGLSQTFRITHAGNNVPWLRQYNAASSAFLSLPWIDDRNHLQIAQPIYGAIASPGLNGLDIRSLLALAGVSGFTDGTRMVYINTNSITGSATGFEAEVSASTRFDGFVVRNNHASGTARGTIETIGTGNASLRLGTSAGYANLTWNGTTIAFDKPPKLPSATVSGAGSASTAGVGALHYVTNLNATTAGSVAAGGGTNKGVIVSDGTDWRIMVAWA
jgi:hypothetical protein